MLKENIMYQPLHKSYRGRVCRINVFWRFFFKFEKNILRITKTLPTLTSMMLIMVYLIAPYFLICQKHLKPLITACYLLNFIATLALEEFLFNYFAAIKSECK